MGGGGLPVDRVADGVPDALHQVRRPAGGDLLVQGAGGASHRAVLLGTAAGYRMWVTSRTRPSARGGELGADQAFESGARLPERVDAVIETVGGGDLVALGQLAKARRHARDLRRDQRRPPQAELTRIFFIQLSVVGSTMGTRDELGRWSGSARDRCPAAHRLGAAAGDGPRRVRGDDRRLSERKGFGR